MIGGAPAFGVRLQGLVAIDGGRGAAGLMKE